jgi:hypothetical protein
MNIRHFSGFAANAVVLLITLFTSPFTAFEESADTNKSALSPGEVRKADVICTKKCGCRIPPVSPGSARIALDRRYPSDEDVRCPSGGVFAGGWREVRGKDR